ncbi:hypothetical protein D3OALGA1CA_4527 [Olavius algarvensis associated proteobacterium Delta 3]|nr:hypothetical protein D3OALGB2SA_2390 [Olavius algarvensis associated proteobacterium Delta 3]CAB5152729.1 hypothetical protein D3OALGA1CA_4527 [Olavius algarvensis associated proteobacterium Delta 3]
MRKQLHADRFGYSFSALNRAIDPLHTNMPGHVRDKRKS